MHPAAAAAPIAPRFFDGFEERFIEGTDGPMFCRIGGDGPPLVLLHGYPQTSAMWHVVAADLVHDYRVICMDLRGYGRSVKPRSAPDHAPNSKRAMAGDVIAVMDALGHDRFLVGAHDRGARVAHRLAADHPDRVRALAILDIAPTREMYREAGSAFAHSYWHWYWLTLPHPFPETLIGADPAFFWLSKSTGLAKRPVPFVQQALDEYLTCFDDPSLIHCACEDYRAAATIDIAHDDADPTRLQMPLLTLWGKEGAIEAHFDSLALWRERAAQVEGWALPGGHFLAEECPDLVIAAWREFFAAA